MSLDKNIKELLRKQPLGTFRRNMSKFVNTNLLSLKPKKKVEKTEKKDSMVSYLDESSFKEELY